MNTPSNFIDLTGRVFNLWTVLERAPNDPRGQTRWLCRCKCGREKFVHATSLLRNLSKTCGCSHKKHGQGGTGRRSKEYLAWAAAKKRCSNPNDPNWKNYGGRGIIMCKEWRENFEAFFSDLGRCPPGLTLDRKDNDGPYDKANCRWATTMEQAANKRPQSHRKLIAHAGQSKILADWAREYRVDLKLLHGRFYTLGWPLHKALTTPPRVIRRLSNVSSRTLRKD